MGAISSVVQRAGMRRLSLGQRREVALPARPELRKHVFDRGNACLHAVAVKMKTITAKEDVTKSPKRRLGRLQFLIAMVIWF